MLAQRALQKRGIRESATVILQRAQQLDLVERVLIEQVLGDGVAPSRIARVAGRSPRTIQRRVRQTLDRLMDPEAMCVLRRCRTWDPTTRQVALRIWVRGRTLRQTAQNLGLTLHQVRRHAATARGMIDIAMREQADPLRAA